jgi:hypothetical protein
VPTLAKSRFLFRWDCESTVLPVLNPGPAYHGIAWLLNSFLLWWSNEPETLFVVFMPLFEEDDCGFNTILGPSTTTKPADSTKKVTSGHHFDHKKG